MWTAKIIYNLNKPHESSKFIYADVTFSCTSHIHENVLCYYWKV